MKNMPCVILCPRFWALLPLLGALSSLGQVNPPVIIGQPQSQVAPLGDTAYFSVLSSGTAPLSYQWQFEGADLQSATGSTLVLSGVNSNMVGNYVVRVTNVAGAVTSAPARLTVVPGLPGSLDVTFNPRQGPNDVVRRVAVQDDGKIVVAGAFTYFGGTNRAYIARLTTDGTLEDEFNPGVPGPDGYIYALAVEANNRMYIGGSFRNVGGVPRAGIARLAGDGTLDTTFIPPTILLGTVWCLAKDANGQLLVGGDLRITNSPCGLVRLSSSGALSPVFTPQISGGYGRVMAVAPQANGQVVVGGNFNTANGLTCYSLARLTSSGAVDTNFNAVLPSGSWVYALALQADGKLLVGGMFNSVNGMACTNLARVNTDGTLDSSFNRNLGLNSPVTSIALQSEGRILIGGGFTSIQQNVRMRIARLLADGNLDATFESPTGPNDWVESIALQSDGQILIGGNFTTVNGISRYHVARLNGNDPMPYPPIIATHPQSHAVYEGANIYLLAKAYGYPFPTYQWTFNGENIPDATSNAVSLTNVRASAGGLYSVVVSNALGIATSSVAVVTVTVVPPYPGGTDIDFYTGTGPDASVNALALQADGKLLMAGPFSSVNGIPSYRLARLDTNGTVDPQFRPLPTISLGLAYDVKVQPDKNILLAGASMNSEYGGYGPRVVRFSPDGTMDTNFFYSFQYSSYGTVMTVLPLENGRILVGGSFPYGLVQVLPTGAVDTNFYIGNGITGTIYALLKQPDGKIVVGGNFRVIQGATCNSIARLNSDGHLDTNFDAGNGISGTVYCLGLQSDGKLLLGGDFLRVNGIARNCLARLETNGVLDTSFEPGPGPNSLIKSIAVQPDGKIVVAGAFAEINGLPCGRVARLHADGSLDLTFNSNPGANGPVNAVLVVNNTAWIGGEFTYVNNIPRPRVARLRSGDPAPFAPVILLAPESQTVVAGQDVLFNVLASAVPRPQYQWTKDGSQLAGANEWLLSLPNVRSTNAGDYAVAVSNPLGTTVSTTATLRVESPPRTPGSPDLDFYTGAGPNDRVYALGLQPDGKVIIGGAFTEVDGVGRSRIARLNRDGSLDTAFDPLPGADDRVLAVVVQPDGKVLVGGAFYHVNGMEKKAVARLNTNGTLDTTFTTPISARSGVVYALALQSDGKVLVGGEFNILRSNIWYSTRLARLDEEGRLDPTFYSDFGPNGAVRAIAVLPDSRIVIGGDFTTIQSTNCYRLARLLSNGRLDPTFNGYLGPSGPVNCILALSDGKFMVGGIFSYVSGVSCPGIARINSDGSIDRGFSVGSGAQDVYALAQQADGKLLLGGTFRFVGNMPWARIGRMTAEGNPDPSFNPGTGVTDGTGYLDEYGISIDYTVLLAMAVEADGKILIGGDFTRVNGIPRKYVARLYEHEPWTGLVTQWLPGENGLKLHLLWELGALQEADRLSGPWHDVPSATKPYAVPGGAATKFYRLKLY